MQNRVILALLSCALVLGCTINDKDFKIKGVESNPTMVAPLATGDLSIMDLLKDQDSSHIHVKSDGLVYLSYDQSLASSDIRSLIDIPNVGNQGTSLAVPAGSIPAHSSDQSSTSITKTVDMGISPEKLTEIAFKAGTLSYNMTLSPSNNNFKYALLLAIPEFKSNATGAGLSQEVTGTGSFQLSNYTYKNATANKFTLQLTLILKANTSPVTIAPGTSLNVTVTFGGMDFKYIKGFFGDQIANPPAQSISVSAFGTSFQNGGSVSFAQPTIDLSVVSEYGVPLKVTFTKLEARKQGSAMVIQTNPASPITVTSPINLGDSATTNVSVTNVKQVADFAPTQFYYQVSGHINEGLSSGNNFMADTSQMHVKLHVEIPLYGKASNIIMGDTLDVDLSDVDQSKIDSASLKAYIVNELPLDANLQFIMTDAKYVFIDSLLTTSQTGIIKGSTVDSNGDLKTTGVYDKSIRLQQDKVSKIFKAKKIIVRAKMNTSKDANGNYVDVKFKSQYKLKVKLGLRTTLKLNATF